MLTGVSAAVAKNTAEGRLEDNLFSLAKIGVYDKKHLSNKGLDKTNTFQSLISL